MLMVENQLTQYHMRTHLICWLNSIYCLFRAIKKKRKKRKKNKGIKFREINKIHHEHDFRMSKNNEFDNWINYTKMNVYMQHKWKWNQLMTLNRVPYMFHYKFKHWKLSIKKMTIHFTIYVYVFEIRYWVDIRFIEVVPQWNFS